MCDAKLSIEQALRLHEPRLEAAAGKEVNPIRQRNLLTLAKRLGDEADKYTRPDGYGIN